MHITENTTFEKTQHYRKLSITEKHISENTFQKTQQHYRKQHFELCKGKEPLGFWLD